MKTTVNTFKGFFLLMAMALSVSVQAQEKKEMASPPAEATQKIGDATITIKYHSPAVKGRSVYAEGALVPTGKVWRTGANNATTFEADKDIMVEGKALPAGKYALFTVANEDEWTIVFNKVADQWGAYDYDEAQDVLRVKVKPKKDQEMKERFNIDIKDKGNKKGEVVLAWEKRAVPFTVAVK